MPNPTGTYEQIDGSPVVRFERTFPHPPHEVWAAVTDPVRLEQWFPTSVEFEQLRAGEPITFRFAEHRYPAMAGAFREVTPPTRLEFSWGDDVLTFELAQRDGGAACRLALSVVLDAAEKAARDSAGWDGCLDMLDQVIAGRTPERPPRGMTGAPTTRSTTGADCPPPRRFPSSRKVRQGSIDGAILGEVLNPYRL